MKRAYIATRPSLNPRGERSGCITTVVRGFLLGWRSGPYSFSIACCNYTEPGGESPTMWWLWSFVLRLPLCSPLFSYHLKLNDLSGQAISALLLFSSLSRHLLSFTSYICIGLCISRASHFDDSVNHFVPLPALISLSLCEWWVRMKSILAIWPCL